MQQINNDTLQHIFVFIQKGNVACCPVNLHLVLSVLERTSSSIFSYLLYESAYRTRAIITRGLYTFYPLFEVQKRFFQELFS